MRRSDILVDEAGAGGGVVDHLECLGLVGNATPFADEQVEMPSEYQGNYQNLRVRCHYTPTDHAEHGQCAVIINSEEFKQFISEERKQIKARDVGKDMRRRIISKDEITEHLRRSPDSADMLMLRMHFEVKQQPEPVVRIL